MENEDNNNQENNTPEHYPVSMNVEYPEKSSRLLALAFLFFMIPKAIMLIPHLIILYFLGIVLFIAAVIAQVVVLFTGVYPKQIHELVVGLMRWKIKVGSYFVGLTDKYPPFSLK